MPGQAEGEPHTRVPPYGRRPNLRDVEPAGRRPGCPPRGTQFSGEQAQRGPLALKALPGHAAVREQLKQRLTDVLAEQQAHRPLRQRNTYNLGRAFTDTWFLA